MIPVLQLNTSTKEKEAITIINPKMDCEKDFEQEIAALKDTKLVPSSQCIEQLFEKLGITEKIAQR